MILTPSQPSPPKGPKPVKVKLKSKRLSLAKREDSSSMIFLGPHRLPKGGKLEVTGSGNGAYVYACFTHGRDGGMIRLMSDWEQVSGGKMSWGSYKGADDGPASQKLPRLLRKPLVGSISLPKNIGLDTVMCIVVTGSDSQAIVKLSGSNLESQPIKEGALVWNDRQYKIYDIPKILEVSGGGADSTDLSRPPGIHEHERPRCVKCKAKAEPPFVFCVGCGESLVKQREEAEAEKKPAAKPNAAEPRRCSCGCIPAPPSNFCHMCGKPQLKNPPPLLAPIKSPPAPVSIPSLYDEPDNCCPICMEEKVNRSEFAKLLCIDVLR